MSTLLLSRRCILRFAASGSTSLTRCQFPLASIAHPYQRSLATRSELAARKAGPGADYPALANDLFSKIGSACAEMAAKNPGFTVARSDPNTITITTGTGADFTLASDPAAQRISLTSPKVAQGRTGLLVYKYAGDQWVNETDGHFLIEMLTRDLIYHCKGYPNF